MNAITTDIKVDHPDMRKAIAARSAAKRGGSSTGKPSNFSKNFQAPALTQLLKPTPKHQALDQLFVLT
eukprot:gene8391-920_t